MKKILNMTLLAFTSAVFGQEYNPVAKSEAIVISENARFTILTPCVVRLEWSGTKKFTDLASLTFINRAVDVPKYSVQDEKDKITIKTDLLELTYIKGEGSFSSKNLFIRYSDGKMSFSWNPDSKNTGNLLGTTRTLDGCDGDSIKGRKPGKLTLEDGIVSRNGWTFIDDTQKPLFDNSDWPWVTERDAQQGYQDWYFFGYGHNYKRALKDFVSIAGKIPVPPKFAFGIWWSRYWEYTDLEFRDLVNEYKIHDIPLDVLVIDMDWHITDRPDWYVNGKKVRDEADQRHGWTGFTWEKGYFPDHKAFLKWTDEQNIKTCLNLHPASGIQPHEEIYPEFAKAMGVDPSTKKYIPFDIVDKNYAKNYFNLVLHPMEKDGIDFWWLDWQQWGNTKIPGVNPTFYLNYVHFSDMQRQGKRPILFHRWGGLGNHRYQIGFSGDTYITWKSLALQPYFTSTASNVCFGYWSHDIGGHMFGDPKNPELFTRWVQWGAFSPIFRTHCTKNPAIERRMWAYPLDNYYAMRDAVKSRIALFPYIYSAAYQAHETGISLIRPLYYDFPETEQAYAFKDQYMFGDDMLVAPIIEPMKDSSLFINKNIWLPEGKWIEMQTGAVLEGNKEITRPYLLSEIPIFVKEGSIIPMKPDHIKIEEPIDELILNIFPGKSGVATIFDDNSQNEGYLKGEFTLTKISSQSSNNQTKVIIEPIQGAFDKMVKNRSYELHLPLTFPPKSVKVNGKEISYSAQKTADFWTYDGEQLSTIVETNKFPTNQKTTIEITFPDNDTRKLSGKPGMFSRIMFVNKVIHNTHNGFSYPVSGYFNYQLAALAQTGYRISLNPTLSNLEQELEFFEQEWPVFYKALEKEEANDRSFRPALEYVNTLKQIYK